MKAEEEMTKEQTFKVGDKVQLYWQRSGKDKTAHAVVFAGPDSRGLNVVQFYVNDEMRYGLYSVDCLTPYVEPLPRYTVECRPIKEGERFLAYDTANGSADRIGRILQADARMTRRMVRHDGTAFVSNKRWVIVE